MRAWIPGALRSVGLSANVSLRGCLMRIIQLTPGAGKMYCGACFRDQALVMALRKLGHDATLTPLYLPASFEEPAPEPRARIFFGGVSVYLEQKSALFRNAPRWFRRALASPWILNRAASAGSATLPSELGELTVSMLRGEEGRQAKELEDLGEWLAGERPEAVCLSNALLLGMARRLKSMLGAPVVCFLQGEDSFLDGLPVPHRQAAWEALAQRARDVDLFIAPSRYFGSLMARRLGLETDRVQVVHNGINLSGFEERGPAPESPAIGFFARMCPEKGLDTLVEAFLLLRARNRVANLKLRMGGYCGPLDEPFVAALRERLRRAGAADAAEFRPNLPREEKLAFLKSLTVFSVPARYSEAFGLYLIEAMAAGIPVVQPDSSAFPEIIAATGGGTLCRPGDPESLADELEKLLLDPPKARALGEAGRKAVFEHFSAASMASKISALLANLAKKSSSSKPGEGVRD